MDELLVKVLLMVRDSSCFLFISYFVCLFFLNFEVRVESSGTAETDRYCSDMVFLYEKENVTLYQKKKVKETDY